VVLVFLAPHPKSSEHFDLPRGRRSQHPDLSGDTCARSHGAVHALCVASNQVLGTSTTQCPDPADCRSHSQPSVNASHVALCRAGAQTVTPRPSPRAPTATNFAFLTLGKIGLPREWGARRNAPAASGSTRSYRSRCLQTSSIARARTARKEGGQQGW